MNPTTTDISEQLTLDGPITLTAAVLVGLGALLVFAWALWRERKILGTKQTVFFWCLRVAAVATVLWMLLAPAQRRVETSRTRRAIALVHDTTGSMRTVDPVGTADELRWAISVSDAESTPIQSGDKAVVAMGLARQHLNAALDALNHYQPEAVFVKEMTTAGRAIERVRSHLERLGRASLNSATQTSIDRQLTALDDAEFQSFQSVVNALEKGRTPTEKGWRESLPDLEYRIAGAVRSLRELARQVAVDVQSKPDEKSKPQLAKLSRQSRGERVQNRIQHLHTSTLESLEDTADVRFAEFAQTVNWSTTPPKPPATKTEEQERDPTLGTDLAMALEQVQRRSQEQPLAATFLFTDAAQNQTSEGSPQEVARRLDNTPVYVVPIGNTRYVRDVILQSVSAPAVAMRNDDVVIEANLEAHDCAGEVCHIELLQDGMVIDFRDVIFDSDFATRSVRFEQRVPEIGRQVFQIAVSPLDRESTDQNNYDEVEVNVTRSDIKVLLTDDMPRWEYRYLTQLFRRDAKVECDELLFRPRMIATGRRKATRTLPTTVDEWDQYDVVLLGDLPPDRFSTASQQALQEYLHDRGGTLVLIAGRNAMPQAYVNHPLEEILPVRPVDSQGDNGARFAFRVTEDGLSHDALMIAETETATRTAWDFVNRYSPLHEVSAWRHPLPSAETLIAAVRRDQPDANQDATSSAFLCWQPIGRGRIVYLAGPETYRLRLLRGDSLHYRFWGQLMRWAIAADLSTGTQFVRIRTNKSRYQTRDEILTTVELNDADGEPVTAENLEIQITSGDDIRTVALNSQPTVPGQYQAAIRSLPPGVYRLEPVGAKIDELQQDSLEPAVASITVQANLPREMVDTRCDLALAGQLADLSGGQVLSPTTVEEVLALTDLEPIVTETIQRKPLWLEWKYLWIVFGCLQTEWIIRKWKGLS